MTPENDSPRIFIAGATGYTGRALVEHALDAGCETIAHIRPNSRKLDDYRHDFEDLGARVDTTPWDVEAMAKTLSATGPTHVFFVIGTTKKRMRNEQTDASYEAVDYGLVTLLLDAIADKGADTGAAPRFVYLSAQGVKKGARTAYYRARWKAEEAVRQSGLPYVIARPGFISGTNRRESRPMERLGVVVGDAAARLAGALGATDFRDRYLSRDNEQMARELLAVGLSDQAANRHFDSEELRRSGL